MRVRAKIQFLLFVICVAALCLFVLGAIPTFVLNKNLLEGESKSLIAAVVSLLLILLSLLFGLRLIRRWRLAPALNPISANAIRTGSSNSAETRFVADTLNSVVNNLQTEKQRLSRLRAQADRRAASAERFSRQVIASLPSGLIAFDHRGFVRLANKAARELLALPDSLTEISYRRLFVEIPALEQMIRASLENKTIYRRETVALNQGAAPPRRLGVTVAPLSADSHDLAFVGQTGVLCLLTDLTEVSALREQLELKRNLASLGEMAAGLTHEFKNSLAVAHSYAQYLQINETDGQKQAAAAALLGEVRSLAQTVNAFLDFARPQKLNLNRVSLRELIEECVRELRELFRASGVSVATVGDFPALCADEILLRRVFLNLLRNAADSLASEQPGSELRRDGSPRQITIAGGQSGGEKNRSPLFAVVEIRDNGAGVAKEDLPFLFVPFFTTKQHGHGLGLALAHRIVTEHNGTLAAANAETGGAVFTCSLPILSADQSPVAESNGFSSDSVSAIND